MQCEDAIVHVVDDDPAVNKSLRWLLESVGLDVRTFDGASAFLDRYERRPPECLVLDVRMPGLSGLDLQTELNRRSEDLPIVFITAHADVPMAVKALKAGASDFVEKPVNDQELLDCIQRAITKHRALDHARRAHDSTHRLISTLSRREHEVMDLVVDAYCNKEIAAKLHIAIKTVEWHRGKMMGKMEVSSVAELVRTVITVRLAEPDKKREPKRA